MLDHSSSDCLFGRERDAARTDCNYNEVIARLNDPSLVRLLHAAIGLATEAGEFADAIKRHVFYGAKLDTLNLLEELGDISWYQRIACDEIGVPFAAVIRMNVNKLRSRFPTKFTEADAIERDVRREREVLEAR